MLSVGARVRVTQNCRSARLVGRQGVVVSFGRQVEGQLDGHEQVSKVNRNEVEPLEGSNGNKARTLCRPVPSAPYQCVVLWRRWRRRPSWRQVA